MGISVDGDSLFTLEETQENGRSVLRTELLPNRELTSAQSALDALFPENETAEPAEEGTDALPGGSFDLNAALTEAEACYRQLTDAIQPYAEEKKANYPQAPDRGGAVLRHGRGLPPANGKPDP